MLKSSTQPKNSKEKLLVILGPTASGKSALGVRLAKKFNGEIISADSRQIYRKLNIGTGKITKKEMDAVPHHLLDIAEPKRVFSVVEYCKKAARAINDIIARGKLPIVVGGSGMYIDAILYGAPYPDVPPNIILRKRLEKKSPAYLYAALKQKDPKRASTIDRYNKRRLIRALEIITATKKPVPPLKKIPQFNARIIGIKKSEYELHRLIDTRLKKRFKRGLITEIKKLRQAGISQKRLFELGLEYRFVSEYLAKKYSKMVLRAKLSRAIKQYAKRQYVWFKQYENIIWIKNFKTAEQTVAKFASE